VLLGGMVMNKISLAIMGFMLFAPLNFVLVNISTELHMLKIMFIYLCWGLAGIIASIKSNQED